MSSPPHSPQCLCTSTKPLKTKKNPSIRTNIPLWPNFSSRSQFTSAFTYWLFMSNEPLEYIIKMNPKNGETRQNLVREWRQGSIKNSICTHIKLCYKGKKFGAKTFLEEFFFFLSGSKWTCIKLLLPTCYSLKEIFPILLKKKKKSSSNAAPYDVSILSKLPSKSQILYHFPPHHPINLQLSLCRFPPLFQKRCMHAFPPAHVYLYIPN